MSFDVPTILYWFRDLFLSCLPLRVYFSIVSGTFQALHSYRLEDIAFDSCFAPCVSHVGGKAVVDLDHFHRVVPARNRSFMKGYESCTERSDSDSARSRRTIFSR